MKEINSNLKHDFINNSLRLEVLMKIISKNLDQNERPENKYLDDLEKFLQDEIKLLKELKSQL